MYNLTNKKIGIWGYGITGKSAIQNLINQDIQLAVLDKKELNATDKTFLDAHQIIFYTQENLPSFLEHCDYILPSPGVDLREYTQYKSKWLNELDLFNAAWHKPIIAITGSIGKTTVTHLLGLLLEKAGKRVATGGNIGIPMLDLLAQQDDHDTALLEVSSFQLEYTKSFAPSLAIWTNFYPNHLDRHGSEQEYKDAKAKLMVFQTAAQQSLTSFELKDAIQTQSTVHYFLTRTPTVCELDTISLESSLYFLDETNVCVYSGGKTNVLIARSELPPISFEANWLILCAAFDLLKVTMPRVATSDVSLPEHRLEHVANINGIDFYNDSKSTTPQSTMAAVNRLCNRPILLLLGGLGKGVDRGPLIKELQGKVDTIYCFGKEADHLKALCDNSGIPSEVHANLETAFSASVNDAQAGDQLLLSPAGSSYDLYNNYMERGTHFKKLVSSLK